MMSYKRFGLVTLLIVLGGCSHFPGQQVVSDTSTGTSIKSATGKMCGGIAGIQCADEGSYCALKPGQCQRPDAAGICTKINPICTREYRPVCGCDGKIYPTACVAQSAGINVLKPSSGEPHACTSE